MRQDELSKNNLINMEDFKIDDDTVKFLKDLQEACIFKVESKINPTTLNLEGLNKQIEFMEHILEKMEFFVK